jgi:hypothetical protein
MYLRGGSKPYFRILDKAEKSLTDENTLAYFVTAVEINHVIKLYFSVSGKEAKIS